MDLLYPFLEQLLPLFSYAKYLIKHPGSLSVTVKSRHLGVSFQSIMIFYVPAWNPTDYTYIAINELS